MTRGIPRMLVIRVCSPQKTRVKEGYPRELYANPMIQAMCKRFPTCHAVLSRRHGVMTWNRRYEQYMNQEEQSKPGLLALLQQQAKEYSDTVLVYWNHRPLTHDVHVRLLRDAGFQVIDIKGSLDDIAGSLEKHGGGS